MITNNTRIQQTIIINKTNNTYRKQHIPTTKQKQTHKTNNTNNKTHRKQTQRNTNNQTKNK